MINFIKPNIFFLPACTLICIFYMLWPGSVFAANINAKSCSQDAVQTAIHSASDGDTVFVPSGNCTWSSPVQISKKAISLIGEGIDKTVVIDETGSTWGQVPLWIEAEEGKPFRISGFTFKGMKKRSTTEPAIQIRGHSTGWRIDNCKFTTTLDGRGIIAMGYGLIHNCIFQDTTQGVSVFGNGDASWDMPLSLGTSNAVFIEDCIFDYSEQKDGALDAYAGARYVFRYNTVINTMVAHHGLDSGGYRSTFSYERYENTFSAPTTNPWTVFGSRGGTGVDFNNVVTGGYGLFSIVTNYRSNQPYAPWGVCDGSNPIDGNQHPIGYPCADQIGRTTDQALAPVYQWNNSFKGASGKINVHNPWNEPMIFEHIKENRDFYNNQPKPGYMPYIYPHPLAAKGESYVASPGKLRIILNTIE